MRCRLCAAIVGIAAVVGERTIPSNDSVDNLLRRNLSQFLSPTDSAAVTKATRGKFHRLIQVSLALRP